MVGDKNDENYFLESLSYITGKFKNRFLDSLEKNLSRLIFEFG